MMKSIMKELPKKLNIFILDMKICMKTLNLKRIKIRAKLKIMIVHQTNKNLKEKR